MQIVSSPLSFVNHLGELGSNWQNKAGVTQTWTCLCNSGNLLKPTPFPWPPWSESSKLWSLCHLLLFFKSPAVCMSPPAVVALLHKMPHLSSFDSSFVYVMPSPQTWTFSFPKGPLSCQSDKVNSPHSKFSYSIHWSAALCFYAYLNNGPHYTGSFRKVENMYVSVLYYVPLDQDNSWNMAVT